MSIFATRYKTLTVMLLALVLAAGCSDQDSAPASRTESPEVSAPDVQTQQVAAEEKQAVTETPEPALEQAAEQAAVDDGLKIYMTYCQACHANGVANAPKLGDKDAWAPRIAKGSDVMFSTVINGLNAMPPKGTCMTCSDDDLRAAMEYMVSQGS